jgi:hypothetical protein
MLVGLVGYKGSGKGVASSTLVHGRGFVLRKFAAPLKSMVHALLRANGLDVNTIERMIEGDLKEAPAAELNGQTPRHVMQTLGTEWGRGLISPTFWIDTFKRRVSADLRFGWDIVVDDVRFPNEAESIYRLGGKLIRIERPGLVVDTQHESERHISSLECPYTLINDGTVEQLGTKVLALVEAFQ